MHRFFKRYGTLYDPAQIACSAQHLHQCLCTSFFMHRFFKRYGTLYDPSKMAVSVKHGGTVPRQSVDALWDKKCALRGDRLL